MAHKSLSLKLRARQSRLKADNDAKKKLNQRQKFNSADDLLHLMSSDSKKIKDENLIFINAEMKMLKYDNNEIKDHDEGFTYQVIFRIMLTFFLFHF